MMVTGASKRRKHIMALTFDLPPEELEVGEELPRKVRFDEGGSLLLDLDTCIEEGIRVGKSLTPGELLRLVSLSDFNRAKGRAIWFLGRRSYASGELRKKLERDFGCAAAAEVVERMVDLGLIRDEEYATYLARHLIEDKRVSEKDAVYKMTARGLDRELAAAAVEALEPDPAIQIRELLETKYRNMVWDEKGMRRTVAALSRRGFSYGDIRDAMRRYTDEDYFEE